jgi:transcriptional regulator with GAF, ATPase, and Fis domain
MKEASQVVQRVAATDATVLLLGESGTGKELFARALHHLSPRRQQPFVALNCAAIPEGLVENELFGHERGAFTGAGARKIGKIELAHHGTIFLDEIGDLPAAIQSKLLRVLEERQFERVGGTMTVGVDVRLITATNRDLQSLVADKLFREDLYFRISAVPITVPPLRDRGDDVLLLAEHFLERFRREFRKPGLTLSAATIARLRSYPWPGNVRELENVLQRAIILAPGRTVRAEDLNLKAPEQEEDAATLDEVVDIADYQPAGSFERQLRDYKIKLAVQAVRENNGNKTMAARSLCISRAYLHRLIRLAEPEVDPMFADDHRIHHSVTA